MSDFYFSVEPEGDPAPEAQQVDRPRGGPERTLLLVIAGAMVVGALALVVIGWASVRSAEAQRRILCYTEASNPFALGWNVPGGPGEDEERADRMRAKLEECGSEFPEEDEGT